MHTPTTSEPALSAAWFTTEHLAGILGVDPSSVRRWRTARPPQGPAFVRLSTRTVRYRPEDVERWMTALRVDPAGAGS